MRRNIKFQNYNQQRRNQHHRIRHHDRSQKSFSFLNLLKRNRNHTRGLPECLGHEYCRDEFARNRKITSQLAILGCSCNGDPICTTRPVKIFHEGSITQSFYHMTRCSFLQSTMLTSPLWRSQRLPRSWNKTFRNLFPGQGKGWATFQNTMMFYRLLGTQLVDEQDKTFITFATI